MDNETTRLQTTKPVPLSLISSQLSGRGDPYATRTHRRIDFVLIAFTLLLLLFAFRISAHSRTSENGTSRGAHSQTNR